MTTATFTPGEFGLSLFTALVVEGALLALIVTVEAKEREVREVPLEIPIAVRPAIDDLPLLKKGGERVKYKLPDMWKKPVPVKRYEAKSAPTPKADKNPSELPTSPLLKRDDKSKPPPPDAELVKQADEDIPDTDKKPDQPNVDEKGAPDGIDEGTEADPLKARAVSLYRLTLIRWFNRYFKVPPGAIPCEELKTLAARAVANVGPQRTVAGFVVTGPTGNGTFDSLVEQALNATVGQTLPPPPDKYPEVLGSTVPLSFSRKDQPCE